MENTSLSLALSVFFFCEGGKTSSNARSSSWVNKKSRHLRTKMITTSLGTIDLN